MKILYLSADPMMHPSHQAGYATHMQKVIDGLKARGHEVYSCFAGLPRNEYSNKRDKKGGNDWRALIPPIIPKLIREGLKDLRQIYHDWNFQKIVEKAANDFSPDIIYERQTYLHQSGAVVSAKEDIPLIVETNNPQVSERVELSGWSPFFRKAFNCEKKVLQSASNIVAVSNALKQYLVDVYNIDEKKLLVIPNAVDENHFAPEMVDGKNIRNQYRLNEDTVIGFVGSFFPWHGIDQLLEAAAKLKERVSGFRIFLVGDGYIRRDLERLVKKLNLETNVIFTGTVSPDMIPQYIAAMDICVQANANWYMSPIKLFEYGAMGKPIIAPKTGPVEELMKNGNEGILINNQNELENALYRFLKEPEYAASCGENFQKRILNEYTWQHVAQKLEKLFLGLKIKPRKTGNAFVSSKASRLQMGN